MLEITECAQSFTVRFFRAKHLMKDKLANGLTAQCRAGFHLVMLRSGARTTAQKPLVQERNRMAKLAERITVDPEQCGGRPCIRGMRIRVTDVLDLLANGLTAAQVLEELPDLEPEDIQACLRFASQRLNHPVVVA